jgi:RHS repeat-associated protein
MLRDPDAGRTTYVHDAAGQLTYLASPQTGRTTFAYDLAGRETLKRLANGSRTTQTYDAAGQQAVLFNPGAGALRRQTYTYDDAGRRTRHAQADGTRTSWTYDSAGQLRFEQRTRTNALNLEHCYDPAGNRIVQINFGSRTTYMYDAANQLTLEVSGTSRTTYSYDASGNRVVKAPPLAPTYYVWDALNRLISAEPVAGIVSFVYDGIGRRVLKNAMGVVRRYVWDAEKLLQETDDDGTTERQYLSTDEQYGDLVSAFDGDGTDYYAFDGLGSSQSLLDDRGSELERYQYQAYGLMSATVTGSVPGLPLPAPLPSPLGTNVASKEPSTWVGKLGYLRDPEIDLYLLGGGGDGRPYDPTTGRFLMKDKVEEADTNQYRYCSNDPVNNTDPSGHYLIVDNENDVVNFDKFFDDHGIEWKRVNNSRGSFYWFNPKDKQKLADALKAQGWPNDFIGKVINAAYRDRDEYQLALSGSFDGKISYQVKSWTVGSLKQDWMDKWDRESSTPPIRQQPSGSTSWVGVLAAPHLKTYDSLKQSGENAAGAAFLTGLNALNDISGVDQKIAAQGKVYDNLRKSGENPAGAIFLTALNVPGQVVVGAGERFGEIYGQQRVTGANVVEASGTTFFYSIDSLIGIADLDEAVRGTDIHTGKSLDSWQRWSRGLKGGGNIVLTAVGGSQLTNSK